MPEYEKPRYKKPYTKYPNSQDMQPMDDYNDAEIVKGNKKVWFLNGDIVRVHHKDRAAGMLTLYNLNQDKFMSILVDEWVRKRKRAYTVRQTGLLINRNPTYLSQLVAKKMIPPPMAANKEGKRGNGKKVYYSEDDVFELRDFFANRHWGGKRKDGLITNNTTPTRQELSRRMGDGVLQYTKNNKGEIVPIWAETI